MDYKYIEQLLERYWECQTSVEEERILRSFFTQADVPAHLLVYKDLFAQQSACQAEKLGDDFDAKVLEQIEQSEPRARVIALRHRLAPLFRAAAAVAIVVTLGNAAQQSFNRSEQSDYNYDTYQDTYHDPNVAYEKVSSALMLVSEGIQSDSLTRDEVKGSGDDVER